ncbi:MAG: hypothetical protein K2M94_03755 [Paramuribaculum sp.]|nr:hypothetical protein [Paramuribaculum sp.]
MKIKDLFITLMVITMGGLIFTSCNDDDDSATQLNADRITDLLCDLHDSHNPGWILQGTAPADEYESSATYNPVDLKSNEYISAFSNKKMTTAGHMIQFFRDGSLRFIDGNSANIESGSWQLSEENGSNYLTVTLSGNTVKGRIVDIVTNFMVVKCDASPLFDGVPTYCEFFFTPESMTTNPVIDKLVAGSYTTKADNTFDFGKYRCTFEPNGWIIQGKVTADNFKPSNLNKTLTPSEYLSVSAGSTHFTMVRHHLCFNRDMTLTLTQPDANGGKTINGNWNLTDSKTLSLTLPVDGTETETKADIISLTDDYCLLFTTLPGDSEPNYYELFWNPDYALYNEYMDILCTPNYKNKKGEIFSSVFNNGTRTYTLPEYGWIVYGYTDHQEYNSEKEYTADILNPGEYISTKCKLRKFTKAGYNLLFMRDFTLEVTEPTDNGLVKYTGTWSLDYDLYDSESDVNITLTINKNGTAETQTVTLLSKASNYLLFKTNPENTTDTKYFELFRDPSNAITE